MVCTHDTPTTPVIIQLASYQISLHSYGTAYSTSGASLTWLLSSIIGLHHLEYVNLKYQMCD